MKNSSNITFTDFSIFWIFFKFLTEKWKTFEKPDFFQIFFFTFLDTMISFAIPENPRKKSFFQFFVFPKMPKLKKIQSKILEIPSGNLTLFLRISV